MAQLYNRITLKKLAAGAGVLLAGALCAKLLFSPAAVVQLDQDAMRTLTTQGTFNTSQGDGSWKIHVFLSTECNFCRKIEPELDRLANVTVYRHLLPGHSAAGRKAAADVWCAENPEKAWKNVAAGLPNAATKCNGEVLEKNLELAKRLGMTSTPSIVYEDGHVSTGMLSAGEIEARIAKASSR
jgi:thiol:disulfide interchange protein DsbC